MNSPAPQIGPRLEVGSDYVSIDSLVIQNADEVIELFGTTNFEKDER